MVVVIQAAAAVTVVVRLLHTNTAALTCKLSQITLYIRTSWVLIELHYLSGDL